MSPLPYCDLLKDGGFLRLPFIIPEPKRGPGAQETLSLCWLCEEDDRVQFREVEKHLLGCNMPNQLQNPILHSSF